MYYAAGASLLERVRLAIQVCRGLRELAIHLIGTRTVQRWLRGTKYPFWKTPSQQCGASSSTLGLSSPETRCSVP